MKIVKNKKTKIVLEKGKKATYADLIELVVIAPDPEKGTSTSEMRKNFKVVDVTEKGGDKLRFEDAVFETVKEKLADFKWGMSNREIVDFDDYIKSIDKKAGEK